jgi:hypothetical protein
MRVSGAAVLAEIDAENARRGQRVALRTGLGYRSSDSSPVAPPAASSYAGLGTLFYLLTLGLIIWMRRSPWKT